ncbi:MAG: hypothetical protein WD738_13725 [Pirellulales bacterium]
MSSQPQPVAAQPPGLPLLRFSLRHLLLFVAVLSTLLAGIVSLHGIPALALLLAAMVVAFHVLGTALGSQLRLHANGSGARQPDPTAAAQSAANAADHTNSAEALTPIQSPWYGRSGASFAWLPRLVAVSVFFGSFLGALYLAVTIGHRTSLAALVIGVASIAVLSGWFAFLAGSFYAIVRNGFREAVDEQQTGESPGYPGRV